MPPALAGLVVGLAYAAISVYWAVGGRWLLNTVGISLSQPGQAGHLAGLLAVWGAAAVKAVAAVLPLLAIVVWPRTANGALRRPARVLTWIEAAILVGYGLVPTASGLLLQAGVIKAAAHADRLALKWHAYLWDPWFLIWGIFVFLALWRSRPEVGGRSTGMPRITSGPCRMGAHITARFHPHATFGRRPGPASAPSVLGEGNTHPAAGQEPLPSGRPARQVRPVRAPTPACRPSLASLPDERGDLDDSYPVHPAPRRDRAAGRSPRRGGPAGHPRRAGPDVGTCLAVQPGARGPGRAAGLDPEPGRARLIGRHLPSSAASPAFPCCSRSFPETHYAVPETPHGS
jgi:hypothetical protein